MVGQPREIHGGAANGGAAKECPRRCGKWWVSQGKPTVVRQMVVQVRKAHCGAANGGVGKESPRLSSGGCRQGMGRDKGSLYKKGKQLL